MCDFWVGLFADEDSFSSYFVESDEYYRKFDENPAFTAVPLKENPRSQGTAPLTRFIGDQGQEWYDTTKGEMGFNSSAASIEELVQSYSYSDQWADELALRVARLGLHDVNAFCFITRGIVASPGSVRGTGFLVEYVGEIAFQI